MATQPNNQARPIGSDTFFWAPQPNDFSNNSARNADRDINTRNTFCTAIPSSQGEDWSIRYVYQVDVVNQIQKRLAYVECDYVQ